MGFVSPAPVSAPWTQMLTELKNWAAANHRSTVAVRGMTSASAMNRAASGSANANVSATTPAMISDSNCTLRRPSASARSSRPAPTAWPTRVAVATWNARAGSTLTSRTCSPTAAAACSDAPSAPDPSNPR